MSKRISRAAFLKGAGAFALMVASGKSLFDYFMPSKTFTVRWLGPSMGTGHQIRDHQIAPFLNEASGKKRIIIAGGGIAGLSAGWWLKKQGFSDFIVLEMENKVGGNSSDGENKASKYPHGAHYVPVPNEESKFVREFFQETGIITGFAEDGKAIYNELYLCHDPQERLYKDGSFQEGLVPKRGLQPAEREEIDRFFATIKDLRHKKGSDNKPAFAIPMDLSSQDSQFRDLDKISMAQWLSKNNFHSRPLLWYVDYCCKDDYGAKADKVSAWAGLHYFSGRRGVAANGEHNTVVTWPEGNGFLVEQLKNKLSDHIKTDETVTAINNPAGGLLVSTIGGEKQQAYNCDYLIFACPRFLSGYLITDYPQDRPGSPAKKKSLTYAPWLVANITLSRIPSARGVLPAWDNVSYYSDSLGYVNSTHQNITTRTSDTVITYYLPLAQAEPKISRAKLLSHSPEKWSDLITADLEKMHPGITRNILDIELWPWGHGMIRPDVGFIWGADRAKMQENFGNIYFAHSDMSGISNFEEAQYQGIKAAGHILEKIGHKLQA